MTSPLRFGIVGCGTIAPTHADAIRELMDAEVTACCDIVPDKAAAFAKLYEISNDQTYSDFSCLLADPLVDVISVCTPSGTHSEIGIQSLNAGKPVLIEKPMDINLAAIDRLNHAQSETGLTLGIISQHRFDAASIFAKDIVSGGRLGQLIACEAQIKWYRTDEYYASGDWRGTWNLDGGGALMNQGVHIVDLMRWIAGPVHSIYAVAKTLAHKRIEVEDTLCATLVFKNGSVGNLFAATSLFPGYPAQFSVHGTKGSIVISGDAITSVDLVDCDNIDGYTRRLYAEGPSGHALQVAQGGTKFAEDNKALAAVSSAARWGDSHREQIADFIQAVRAGRAAAVDGKAGREAVEVILAAYESARTGQAVLLS